MKKKQYYILLLTIIVWSSPLSAQQAGDNFFYSSLTHEIRLTFNQPNYWDSLHYYKQLGDSTGDEVQYMLAKVEIDGNTLDSIGVRFKGNSTYKAPTEKKSFKLDFNEYVSGQKYDELKKLNLNNEVNDPTFLREKLLFDYLQTHNLQGPRCTFSNVYVNNSSMGLYCAVEQINKTFLTDNFGNKDGNLFKGDPQGRLAWKGPSQANYYGEYELKTNEDINDWSDLVNLIDTINNTPANRFKDALGSVFNTSAYLKSWAVNILFVSLDSYIGSAHNYYIYHNSATDLFDWITWDANGSFGLFNVNMTEQELKDLSVLYVKNPLGYTPLNPNILLNDDLKTEYLSYIAHLLATDFDTSYFYPLIDSLADWIRDDVYADTMKTFTNQNFEDNANYTPLAGPGKTIPALKDFLAARILSVQNELNAMGIVAMSEPTPKADLLLGNYPNPFSGLTTITYKLPEVGNVSLTVYNQMGEEITRLVDEIQSEGSHSTEWNAASLASGIYFCKLKLDNSPIQIQKLIVIQ